MSVDYKKRTSRKKIDWEEALAIDHLDPEKMKRDFHHDLHPRCKLWAVCWQEIEWAKIKGFIDGAGVNRAIVALKRLSSMVDCELPDMVGNVYAIFEKCRDEVPIQRELEKLQTAVGKNKAALAQIGQPLFDTPPPTRHTNCQSISLTPKKSNPWNLPADKQKAGLPEDLSLGQLACLLLDAGAQVTRVRTLIGIGSWTAAKVDKYRKGVHLDDNYRERIEEIIAEHGLMGIRPRRKAQ